MKRITLVYIVESGCGKQNNGPPEMPTASSQNPVNMLPYTAKGTLQLGLI